MLILLPTVELLTHTDNISFVLKKQTSEPLGNISATYYSLYDDTGIAM